MKCIKHCGTAALSCTLSVHCTSWWSMNQWTHLWNNELKKREWARPHLFGPSHGRCLCLVNVSSLCSLWLRMYHKSHCIIVKYGMESANVCLSVWFTALTVFYHTLSVNQASSDHLLVVTKMVCLHKNYKFFFFFLEYSPCLKIQIQKQSQLSWNIVVWLTDPNPLSVLQMHWPCFWSVAVKPNCCTREKFYTWIGAFQCIM